MGRSKEDDVLYFQISMAEYLMERWGKTTDEFIKLDSKYEILKFLKIGYDSFDLIGDEEVAVEIEDYIKLQGGENDWLE